MSQLKTSVVIDLAGNLQQQANRYERSLTQFSQSGRRHLGLLKRTAAGAGHALDRIGNRFVALATGGALVAAGKKVGDLSARINQLGIDAGFNGEALDKFKEDIKSSIFGASIAFSVGSNEIISGIEDIVQKTGDIDFATRNIDNLAASIAATSGAGGDFGRIMAELQKMGVIEPERVLALLDGLVAQGQQGAFTLKDMATLSERVFAAYSPENIQQVREMGAVLQYLRASTGTSEQATTSFEALMRLLTDGSKLKVLRRFGVEVRDANRELLPLPQVIENIVKATQGDDVRLSAMISEAEARRGFGQLMRLYRETGSLGGLHELVAVGGSGAEILKDASDNAKEFNRSMTRLSEILEKFAETNLAAPIQDLADAINSLEPGKLQSLLETAKELSIALGGMVIGAKVIKGGLGLGGVATGVAAASGVGMVGKAGARALSTGAAGLQVAGAGVLGYGAGSLLYSGLLEGTSIADVIGREVAKALTWVPEWVSEDTARNARAALASEQAAKIEIELTGPGASQARVRRVDSSGLDITASGAVMGSD